MNHIELAKEVSTIAREAGAAILKIYNESEDIQIERKADESPLTLADRTANRIICDALERLPVRYPIVSEENKAIPYAERRRFTESWLVDPLDGTKEFIKRNGEFTVNIALVKEHTVTLGVVYAPCLDELFWAVRGEGAYLEKDGVTTRLQAAAFTMRDAGLRVVCSRSHLNEDTQAFIDDLNQPEKVSKGSSLKFLVLARGEAHLYPRLAPTMEWDTGAAQIVLEEAGGKVIEAQSGRPLRYNKEHLLNPHFIAYGQLP